MSMRGIEALFRSVRLPGERALQRMSIHPNGVTAISVACGLGAAIAFAAGALAVAGGLYLASGILDAYDGRLARASGRASRAGAMLDSVADRYVELAVFIAIDLHAADRVTRGAALLALSGSLLVSYARARGEALGAKLAGVGFLRRPERVLIIGAGAIGAAVWGPAFLTAVLGLVGVLAHLSAFNRLRSAYLSLRGRTESSRAPAASSYGASFSSSGSSGS